MLFTIVRIERARYRTAYAGVLLHHEWNGIVYEIDFTTTVRYRPTKDAVDPLYPRLSLALSDRCGRTYICTYLRACTRQARGVPSIFFSRSSVYYQRDRPR